MKYNQNLKILQITEKTLIVGVDIAKEIHHARAFDFRGIEYGKHIEFSNDIDGMEKFFKWAVEIMNKSNKEHLMVGMEPTGHYWLCFAQFLRDKNHKVVLVNPFHVKRSKEFDDNSPTKNDRKDPKTIAMLYLCGLTYIMYLSSISKGFCIIRDRRHIIYPSKFPITFSTS
jgi:transposase